MYESKKIRVNQLTKEALADSEYSGIVVYERIKDVIKDIQEAYDCKINNVKNIIYQEQVSFSKHDMDRYEYLCRKEEYERGIAFGYADSLDKIREIIKMLKCSTFEEGYYVWGDLEPSIDEDNEVQAAEGEFELEWEEI